MSLRFRWVLLLMLASGLLPALHAQREKLPDADLEFVDTSWPDAKKTSTGSRYVVQAEGTGEPINPGDMVKVIYAGRLLNGKVIDQTIDRKHPFSFRAGRGHLIEGWDQFMLQMKLGERCIVIIPPEMA